MKNIVMSAAVLLTMSVLHAGVADKTDCPLHEKHTKQKSADSTSRANGHAGHGSEVDRRHDTLGMSHSTSTHSFRLFDDGGAIELRANHSEDRPTVEGIRVHLRDIAGQFSKGDFSTPGFVHGYAPDGVEPMKELGEAIRYTYEELPEGGRIRIRTNSSAARDVIHAFLRFQIIEHRTADSAQVEKEARR